ncbi:MAG TPA: T7SS effector LXG polymorphic toxin [Pseudogracilibacillus sp.]|nr:T7SS effector LXG polymorphic toxin [Pseudogracilibacillus sp.]
MGHKVDIAEVIALSDKVRTAAKEIEVDVESAKKDIGLITGMDSFSGASAKNAKNYLNDLHLTLLGSFDVLFEDLNQNLRDHIDTFKSNVDSSTAAVIQSDYLETVKQDIDLEYKKLKGLERNVERAIDNISDIVSVTKPTLYKITDSHRNVTKFIDDLDSDLQSFTKKGKGDDNSTKEFIQQIEVVMNKASATEGETRFTNYKHGTADPSMIALKEVVKYTDKGMDTIHAHQTDRMNQKKPQDPGVNAKNDKVSLWSKAKNVGKSFGKNIAEGAKNLVGIGKHMGKVVTGPAGGALSYYDNLHEAHALDKTGVDAHIHAAEDTAIDIAIGAGVTVAAAAAVSVAAPIIGAGAVATTVTVAGAFVLNEIADLKIFNGKSAKDHVKKGYRKLKGWLFGD